MRKFLIFLAIFAVLLTGCGKNGPDIDFEALLRQEAFPETDAMSEEMNAAVEFSGLKAGEDTVTFTVSAPDVAKDLIAWYESQEHFSGEELEAKIRELLRGEREKAEFTLSYTVDEDGVVTIHYTEEYRAHMSCGIREFYSYLYDQILGGGA